MTIPIAPTLEVLLGEIKRRLGDFVVEGWEGRSGDEVYQAIARVFSHLAQRIRFYLLSGYTRRAAGAQRHQLTLRLTWSTETTHAWSISAGQLLFTTAWGARFRMLADLTRAAAAPPGSMDIIVEAEWSGFDYFVAPNTVTRFAFDGVVDPVAGLSWTGGTTSDGKAEFIDSVVNETLTVTNPTPGEVGALGLPEIGATGLLDLLGIERMIPRELDEGDEVYRARVRAMPDILTPPAIVRAVRAALLAGWEPLFGSEPDLEAVAIHEYWNYGYGFGRGGFGVHPPARRWSFAVSVPALPETVDEAARAALWAALLGVIEHARAPGIWGALYEQADPWTFSGTAPLVSDGAEGSYAEAASSALAHLVFPGAAPRATVSFWLQTTSGEANVFGIGEGDEDAYLFVQTSWNDDPADFINVVLGSADDQDAAGAAVVSGALTHLMFVIDDSLTLYVNGTAMATDPIGPATWSTVDTVKLFGSAPGLPGAAGSIRSLAVWQRALAAAEADDIYNAGMNANLALPIGDYAGPGSVWSWYPAKGDTGPLVIDRGSLGCNLTRHGGVTVGTP